MAFGVLVLLIAVIGYMLRVEKERRFDFLKAFGVILVQMFAGFVFIALFFAVIFGLNVMTQSQDAPLTEGLFSVAALAIALAGVVLYFVLRLQMRFVPVSMTSLTIIEYYIQWSLIYITVYQVVFDNLLAKALNIQSLVDGAVSITEPTAVMIIVLPALMATWISVILYKFKVKEI